MDHSYIKGVRTALYFFVTMLVACMPGLAPLSSVSQVHAVGAPLEFYLPDSRYYQQQYVGDTTTPQALPSTSLHLEWNPVDDPNLDHYALAVGSSPGSTSGVLANGWITTRNNAIDISGLPDDGRQFYIRIFANLATGYEVNPGVYSSKTYMFVANGGDSQPVPDPTPEPEPEPTPEPPPVVNPQSVGILSPSNGEQLSGTPISLEWTDVQANSYDVFVGTSVGDNSYYSKTGITGTQVTASGSFPTDGSPLYVTVYSNFDNNEIRQASSSFSIFVPVYEGTLTGIWANNGQDKVTRDELRFRNNPASTNNSAWDGQKVRLFGGKNEVVAFNLVLEAADEAASGVDVHFDRLVGPGGYVIGSESYGGNKNELFDWTNRDIELFYVRYLPIKGVSTLGYSQYDERHAPERFRRPYTVQSDGWGTGYRWTDRPDHDKYYPDIAVPLELERPFVVQAGQNQSIWSDIYIPKDAPAGLYQGEVTVTQEGNTYRVPVQLEVKNFTLPDEPTAKTMVFASMGEEGQIRGRFGYTNDNLENQYFKMAHRHKISLIDGGIGNDRPSDAWIPRLNGSLFTSGNGYRGPGEGVGNGVYSIGTYGGVQWLWNDDRNFSGSIFTWLSRAELQRHADAWESWFVQNFPDTERLVYLMDEPGGNYADLDRMAKDIEESPGPGKNLLTLVTAGGSTGKNQMPHVDISPTWMSVADTNWGNNYASYYLNDPGKRLYFYNAKRPATGSLMTEDDGVAPRVVAWAQYKHNVDRWFYWESTYYHNFDGSSQSEGNAPHTNVFQRAHTFGHQTKYDNSTDPEGGRGETGSSQYTPIGNGDGLLFYPGTDVKHPAESYGLAGPIASLRLKLWRRGLQDVDYLSMAEQIDPTRVNQIVQQIVPKVLWEVGVEEPGATWLRDNVSWSSNPDVWEAARLELAQILEDANGGTPVPVDSDNDGYDVNSDCNDNDSAINPGSAEILYDGIDNDCNPATADEVDADGDGYNSQLDCNDNNATVNPGAQEITGNGIDDDCDPGTSDEVVPPPPVDSDNDGYDVNSDCNDSDPAINPGSAEILYDGIDNDCNPATADEVDADADGYNSQLDCNDENADVHPGATEVQGNGIDDDCDPATSDEVPPPPQEDISSEGLVSYLRLDIDGSDSSFRGNGIAFKGDAHIGSGKFDGALVLDGSGDYGLFADSRDINLDTFGQRSISLWFKASQVDTRQVLYEEGAQVRGLAIYIDAGNLYVSGWNTPSNESSWQGTYLISSGVSPGAWHHVVLTLDGGDRVSSDALRGYLDGIEFARGAGSMLWAHSGNIAIGAVDDGILLHDGSNASSGSHAFSGSLDDVRIYNRALSATEVSTLFALDVQREPFPHEVESDPIPATDLVMMLPLELPGSIAPDYSGRGNAATLRGGALAGVQGIFGKAVYFDGIDDYLHFADSSDVNMGVHAQRSISLQFKADRVAGRQVLYEEGGTVRGLNIYLDGGELYVGGWNEQSNESNWQGSYVNLGSIQAGQWYHVALTLDGTGSLQAGAFRGYVNGTLGGSAAGSQVWEHSGDIGVGATNNDTKFHDGDRAISHGDYFAGTIDDVRVYNRTLSATEVSLLSRY